MNLQQNNLLLKDESAENIIHWALSNSSNPILSTSFSEHSAALLHLVTRQRPDIPVIWIDNGYNTNATYRFANKLTRELNLNLKIYSPQVTTAYLNVTYGGIPDIQDDEHELFTDSIKLEPFRRAINELKPDMWITGIRQNETAHRKNLDILTLSKDNLIKASPLFYWKESELNKYLSINNLPKEGNYFDPTKSHEGRECGLHTKV